MVKSSRAQVKFYLVEDKSSHEGSGGGFSVVRFFHLCVDNRSLSTLRRVKVQYRLMKGTECFQEDALVVEQVSPGHIARSDQFIRDSDLFDRIEWVGDPVVDVDPPLPLDAITLDKRIPGTSRRGCLIALLGLLAAAAWLIYWFGWGA